MDPIRQQRRKEIGDALRFIQSSLPFPDSGGYQDFLIKLVCNLLKEGNCWFRDGYGNRAVSEFSEALNVSHYASAEGIQIPQVLLESLYVNRATAYHSMKEYSQCVKDCDTAMEVCKRSHRMLYLKALCLKHLGKYKEAYDCTRDCMLTTRQDKQVNDLAEELANHLGLKKRKPYVSAHVGNDMNSLSQIAAVSSPSMPQSELPAKTNNGHLLAISGLQSLDTLEDCQLIGDDLDSLLDSMPHEQEAAEIPIQKVASLPSRESTLVLPAPTPHLPSAFFNSATSHLNSNSLGGHNSLDTLDDLSSPQGHDSLDNLSGGVNAPKLNSTMLDSSGDLLKAPPCAKAAEADQSKTDLKAQEKSLDDLLVELQPVGITCDRSVPAGSVSGVDKLDSLDSLDLFPSVEGGRATLPALPEVGTGLDQLCNFSSTAVATSNNVVSPIKRSKKKRSTCTSVSNPLSATHEFMQACSTCFPRRGQGIFTFVHKPDLVHTCKRDILLCRRKAAKPTEWTRVRQPPTWTSFTGPFVLCRELLKSGDVGLCKFGEKCTFAFNQLEIDVWTEERKGTLDRNLLFGPTDAIKLDPTNSIIRLVQEHKGMFIFLCQECYERKPRIISKRCQENYTLCSNAGARHSFDANKCLAFVVRTTNVNYRKVRPLSVLALFEMCPQVFRYGCLREESCHYAHSVIELKTWRVQRDTGISPDEIVKVSTEYHEKQEQSSSSQRFNRSPAAANGESKAKGSNLNMKMNFACAQCWRGGNVSVPDKTLKYCSAKAKHMWTKEQYTLLVKTLDKSKWVPVRPLPHTPKNFPIQYEMCNQILEKKKCNYSGKCTFAHSEEEKDMWMYMKNQDIRDMQQMYDMWLTLSTHNRQADGAVLTQPVPEEKYIIMPMDNAEQMSGFYCHLCGKHSNGERQWQQHISTLKHRERVFSYEGEDEALTWTYRFPGSCFQLCSKLEGGCPDGASCDSAHSHEELQEWMERRDILRQRLAKAREDMLIMPDEFDFGKYNFLLQESDKEPQKNCDK
ncbi:zinc finger CCCH domain-containing protein 7B-like isoform X2 [Dunckerocampus dactyliophorus]|uniref:zinc finger CCCH domain-containing protein 7B-like isoform X2 n=1 Tax=Dunckerocampus dactyliophorus TaxID=161453 RepID=UPI0024058395|nr:zinc finger CCCH domain-containing protein 7B-like isoform X2 [Dunckerocampus dactyliophorus]